MFHYADGCANFKPGEGKCDEKVAEFTECEHRTAEYEAERSTDITHQSQYRVGLLSFDVYVLQLREKYLHSQEMTDQSHAWHSMRRCNHKRARL